MERTSQERKISPMDSKLPLSRFKVLDLTRVRAGPSAVRQLADWGADVIKVEMPLDDDDGGYTGTRHSADFQNLHRNKRSMTLDLKSEAGKEILRKLVAQSDVLVENYRPDVKFRLGIDYESLRKINPRLVYASISGFGQDGPYAKRPGVDQIAQGMSGFMSVTGHHGQGPVRAGAAIGDVSSGLYCSIGILIALLERESSGEGQWVQTSLLESMFGLLDFQAAGWLFDHKLPRQAGNDHPKLVPTGAFKTKDGYINIGCNQQRWLPMCRAMGVEEMAHRPGFAAKEERLQNREVVNAALTEVFQTRTSAEWVDTLNAAGVPCGPIYNLEEAFSDPQVRHIGIAADVDHPKLGRRQIVGQPIHMSRTQWAIRTAAPEAGEHTDEILRSIGYDGAAIDAFRKQSVV
jgi:crotonobetainyl-CoA:carnitine CoA-transferase CaiB-like acyl-CoA transferase